MSGSSSRSPVVTSTRRTEIRCPPASSTENAAPPCGTSSVTLPSTATPPYRGELLPTASQQLPWRKAVAGEVPVNVGGWCVAGFSGVDDDDLASGTGEDQGGGEAGGSSADHRDVVLGLIHVPQAGGVRMPDLPTLLFPGNQGRIGRWKPRRGPDRTALLSPPSAHTRRPSPRRWRGWDHG